MPCEMCTFSAVEAYMTNADDAKGLLTPLANRCRISNTIFTLYVMFPEDSSWHFEKRSLTGDIFIILAPRYRIHFAWLPLLGYHRGTHLSLSKHCKLFWRSGALLLTTRFNSPPWTKGHHFADDIFRCIFVNEKFCILITTSLFVPEGPFDNNPTLIKIMAWRRIGDKPLSETMLKQFTNIYMG